MLWVIFYLILQIFSLPPVFLFFISALVSPLVLALELMKSTLLSLRDSQ